MTSLKNIVILHSEERRQEYQKFKASLIYIIEGQPELHEMPSHFHTVKYNILYQDH